MDPILLTGYPQGSSAGLVTAFEWLGQPYRLSRVKMPDDMASEPYGRLNRRRETPVLITDAGPLTETMAIALWIEARDKDRRISFEPGTAQADRLHQYMGFINSSFTAAFSPLWAALELKGVSGEFRDVLRQFGRRAVAKRHQQLEDMIGEHLYLAADKPTLADALFVGVARWADVHEAVDPSDFPRVAALRQKLEADPAFQFASRIEKGQEAEGSGAMVEHVPLTELLQGTPVAV
jgi:glutathione S-transferase